MPAQGISMNKIREILRLHFDSKLSQHQIAASLKMSSGVVNKYIKLARAAALSWPIDSDLDDKSLRVLLRPYKYAVKLETLALGVFALNCIILRHSWIEPFETSQVQH